MDARELLRHVFSWEIAPGVPADGFDSPQPPGDDERAAA
jgi:hypothetical protein